MKPQNPLLVILLILSNLNLYAQSGFLPSFIVSHQNDTLIGTGNMGKNQDYCLFKRFGSTDYTKYFPYQINAFRVIDGKYYVSRKIEEADEKEKWYFLEYLIDGEIDLFTISNSNRFFIKREGEGFFELNDNIDQEIEYKGGDYLVKDTRYLGYMKYYMADAPELFPEIEKMRDLNQRNMVNLSVKYHNAICNEYECVNYTKNIPDVTFKIELIAGATYHNAYYAPMTGLLLHIWQPLKNEKLFLKTGIIFSDRRHISKEYHQEDDFDYNIKVPFSFQYVFGKKPFKPTLAFGFPTGMYLVSSLQGGFIYSVSERFEFSLSGSLDGLLAFPFGLHEDIFDNNFGHTINFGLIYLL
jgi:hypothetical protein